MTNQNSDVHDYISKKYGLGKMFGIQFVSGKIGYRKPQPEMYRYAMKKLGVEPGNAYFIDDNIENVEAAKKLGIKGIHFTSLDNAAKQVGK